MQKKKILIVGNSFWSFKNFRLNLIKQISNNNKTYILSTGQKKYLSNEKIKNCELININFDSLSKNIFKEIKTFYAFFKICIKIKPNIIFAFHMKPIIYFGIISKLLNIKIINTISGSGRTFNKTGLFNKILKKLYIYAINNSHKNFFQNKYDLKFIFKKNIDQNNFLVQGSGVDLKKFKYSIPDFKQNIFLYASRLIKPKGIEIFLEAAEKTLQKKITCKFLVVGQLNTNDIDAISKKKLEFYINNKIITYLGHKNNIISYIKKSSCVVLPTILNEGVPKILIESAAIGRPIITMNKPGCNEVLQVKKNGFCLKRFSSSELANKFENFINLNTKTKFQFSKNSRKIAENKFDEKFIINKYVKNMFI